MAALSAAPWIVLDSPVHFAETAIQDPSEWKALYCSGKKAYGCGHRGESVLEDLTLLARFVPPPGLSSLCIRASPRVVEGERRILNARVVTTDKNLAVIWATFGGYPCYLIYDSSNASLTMIPDPLSSSPRRVSWARPAMGTWPIPVQFGGGDGTAHPVLVFLEETRLGLGPDRLPQGVEHLLPQWMEPQLLLDQGQGPERPLDEAHTKYLVQLCPLTPPPPVSSQASSSSSSSVLRLVPKTPVFPHIPKYLNRPGSPWSRCPEALRIHEAFSCGGMCFWVDLLRGVLFCEHGDLLASDLDQLQFRFIDLPPEHQPDHTSMWDPIGFPPNTYRTMACVGDSIMFLTIEIHFKDDFAEKNPLEPGNRKLTIWTLQPETWQWNKYGELCMEDLWQLEEFKRARLPKSPCSPRNPILCDDGSFFVESGKCYFYMMIGGDDDSGEDNQQYMICVCVDIRGKVQLVTWSTCSPSPILGLMPRPILAGDLLFYRLVYYCAGTFMEAATLKID